jgi:hypothetical protein
MIPCCVTASHNTSLQCRLDGPARRALMRCLSAVMCISSPTDMPEQALQADCCSLSVIRHGKVFCDNVKQMQLLMPSHGLMASATAPFFVSITASCVQLPMRHHAQQKFAAFGVSPAFDVAWLRAGHCLHAISPSGHSCLRTIDKNIILGST